MHELASKMLFEADTKGFNDLLIKLRGWKSFKIEYPIVDIGFLADNRKSVRVRMICDNWNEVPPSIQLLSIEGEFLSTIPKDPAGIFNGSSHPITNRPFICMRGSREYHTHSSHTTDSWEQIKGIGGYDLGGILTQVWRAWNKAQP